MGLRNFRNLEAVDITPDRRFNVVTGANGQGKTNLLEAIHLVATLKSFRTFRNQDLIREGEEGARCEGAIDRGGSRREIAVRIGPRGRRVAVNGVSLRRLSEFFGSVNTVAFCPEDIFVFRGSKSDRRLILDRMIFNAQPVYAAEASDYEDALRHRNALIREGRVDDPGLLAVYDQQLVELGTRVIERRGTYVDRLREPLTEAFGEIFGAGYATGLEYLPSIAIPDTDDSSARQEAYEEALRRSRSADLARGFTTVGPHRDDLRATINDRPLKEFASQGQQRSYVLAMKISEIRLLREQLGYYPVLLLDDVSSELDPERNKMLFDFLSAIDGQVFITTTDVSFIQLSHPFTRWDVHDGQVTRGEART